MKKILIIIVAILYLTRPYAHCQGRTYESTAQGLVYITRDTAYTGDSTQVITIRRSKPQSKADLLARIEQQQARVTDSKAAADRAATALAREIAALEALEAQVNARSATPAPPAPTPSKLEPGNTPAAPPPPVKPAPKKKKTKRKKK